MGTKVDTLETRFEKLTDEVEALKRITSQLIELCKKRDDVTAYFEQYLQDKSQVQPGVAYRLKEFLSQLNK